MAASFTTAIFACDTLVALPDTAAAGLATIYAKNADRPAAGTPAARARAVSRTTAARDDSRTMTTAAQGPQHPETLTSMNNLAMHLQDHRGLHQRTYVP